MEKNGLEEELNKINKEPYKGVRDFYPEDMFVQNYIFDVMRKIVESFGYTEYSASILEPTSLYKAKSGQEIVNEQTYTFTDRGGREVTLRPEMTPTLARMVAKRKRDLVFPLRWYSIPNMFRYERPQKGRLREHWQLNVDIFGVKSIDADVEIISLAYILMKKFGAKDNDFEIRVNSRKILNSIFRNFLNLDEEEVKNLMKLIDRKEKIGKDDFEAELSIILGEKSDAFIKILKIKNILDFSSVLPKELVESEGVKDIQILINKLRDMGIKNVIFSPGLVRGFDYYTSTVFEIYDTNPNNNRAMFGGGRYDDLLDIFGEDKIPAIGFGMGDVTIRDFLETHKLLPNHKAKVCLYICTLTDEYISHANKIAIKLRENDLNVEVDLTSKKVSDQLSLANKKGIPFVVCVGENEVKTGKYKIKNMDTGEEKEIKFDQISNFISSIKTL
ncbi:histidine--tRNA ligase [Patescibacteria group bacterium]|nr:histidine--tRNA ligase [Patescibacteria group bacterium]MBU4057686.1 histidine--tRNA ligase [Patescibacteria group bacterium]MBU4115815.1 histidine--tRNA ligase [Patescibacteria group bacterium]